MGCKQPKRFADEYVNLAGIPDPPRPIHANQEIWRCYLAGVGGMGIGLSTALLSTAGHEMGYRVQFLDKKGLAIRNGGVYSQIVFSRMNRDHEATSLPGTLSFLAQGEYEGLVDGAHDPTSHYVPYPVREFVGNHREVLGPRPTQSTRWREPASPESFGKPREQLSPPSDSIRLGMILIR